MMIGLALSVVNVMASNGVPYVPSYLLQEMGDKLLLEDGGGILLE